jgi:hypothetical protein
MSSIITLNVGGSIYTTTLATLTSSGEGNYFSCLLSDRFPILRDESGHIFVDRDGKSFRYILNYLRTGALHVMAATPTHAALVYSEILEEARFFSLQSLVDELERRIVDIEEHENTPKINVVVTELQRLQRQLKAKAESPTTPFPTIERMTRSGSTPQRSTNHQQQPLTPVFDLNTSF